MKMVKVKFEKNGYETEMRENIAAILEKRGELKIIKTTKSTGNAAEK